MSPKQASATRRRWRRWIKTIGVQVSVLCCDDWLFQTSMDVARASKRIEARNHVYQLYRRMYATHASVALRRLVDKSARAYSLRLLLAQIERHSELISRTWFVHSYPRFLRSFAEQSFNTLAGDRAKFLPRRVVRKDLRNLERQTKRIKTFVDKFIAHRDRRPGLGTHSTYQHLHDSISAVDRLCCRYKFVLWQTGLETHLPGAIRAKRVDCEEVWGRFEATGKGGK